MPGLPVAGRLHWAFHFCYDDEAETTSVGASAGRFVTRGGRLVGMAGCAALALAPGLRAEPSESLAKFWGQEQASRVQSGRHGVRPTTSAGPRRPGPSVERRSAPDVMAAKTAVQSGFVVGIFGDLFGATVASGLKGGALPDAVIVDQTGDDGELTRSGIEVWRGALDAAASNYGRIDAAVLMLGADETDLTGTSGEAAERAGPGSWATLYGDRVEQLAVAFRDRHIPVIWVGLPPVRDDDESRRFLDINTVVRDRAVKAGAIYLDTWEAFTDENGAYTPAGPDVDGQPAKLRRNDGRSFTYAGARKLASFVEEDLKRVRDGIAAANRLAAVATTDQNIFDQALQIDVNALIRREAGLPPLPGPTGPEADGLVFSLTVPPVATGGRLATSYDAESHLAGLAATTLDKGRPPPSRVGRTDDFTWPRP